MNKYLSLENIKNLIQSQNLETISLDQLTQFVLEEKEIGQFAPEGICQIDPRNGDRIVFNSARASRPHDNKPTSISETAPQAEKECPICQGKTTAIIDMAPLSEGFTFINKNLFPIFYPDRQKEAHPEVETGHPVYGFHFLQWTSSLHDKDWHNMPREDRITAMTRLAALEKKLLSTKKMYVSIIKNYGHLVGGSLSHGHQQIGASNLIPNRYRQNKQFQENHGELYADYILRQNPPELTIRDYGSAVLLIPYFMRRPFDMQLILKDTAKSYLYQLNDEEITAVVDGWRDAIQIMFTVMTRKDREPAYNITTNNGPGAGLYFEFLPYTQEMGGFEHLGLFLCQENPFAASAYVRGLI